MSPDQALDNLLNAGRVSPVLVQWVEVVRDEITRLRAEKAEAVKTAFHEGWDDGHAARDAEHALEPTWDREQGWEDSEARRRLAEEKS